MTPRLRVNRSVHIRGRWSVYLLWSEEMAMRLAASDAREGAIPTEVEGDVGALFRAEAPGVYRTLLAYTGGRADVAEEAVAEAFARALAQGEALHYPLRWIYRTAFNLANDELRRERRRTTMPVDGQVSPPELIGLFRALWTLSPNQRAAVVLRHVVDLDVLEVARRMDVSPATVRVHLFRARRRLHDALDEEDE